MPSPVGHTLIGLAIGTGWLLPHGRLRAVMEATWRARWALVAAVVLANLPDIDYLPGWFEGDWNKYHHLHTHTVGWIAATSLVAWWLWRRRAVVPPRALFAFIVVLGLSHIVADLFSADNRPPVGEMVLWPFSGKLYISPHTLFWNLRKDTPLDMFQWHNVLAVLVEVAWCLPPLLAVLWWKTRLRSGLNTEH